MLPTEAKKKTPPPADPYVAPPPEQTYAPVEPGMYEPTYTGPGQYAEPVPVTRYGTPVASNPTPPPVEPGMYDDPYAAPGQYARPLMPLEPGIYEPTYTRPGEYAPRESASTYYGGPVPIPYHDGTANPRRQIPPWGNPGLQRVETLHPASSAPAETRTVPILGGATVLQPGVSVYPESDGMPGAMSRGDILGAMSGGHGSAPPVPTVTLGPTATEMGYRYQQGDPGVVAQPGHIGLPFPEPMFRRDLAPPVVDQLAGLFGGGERRSSQPMPLPPGAHRGPNRPTRKR